MSENPAPANRLLAALPETEYLNLFPKLEEIPLIYGKTLYEPGEIIKYLYFPESGIVSLLTSVENNATLEVGLIGSEGIVGLPVFLGVETSRNLTVVQGTGTAMRISMGDFKAAHKTPGSLPGVLQRYTHSLLTQVSQSAVCYRFHSVEVRLARWLLMTADRLKSNEFRMTQEFLSGMLGVRREAVNRAAGILQKQQLLSYHRGLIEILDRTALESAACDCYGIIREEENYSSVI